MNILLLGSGGREHALAWKIAASPLLDKLYCAPGNAGIAQEAECVALDLDDHAAVIAFCQGEQDRFRRGRAGSAAGAPGIVDDLEAAGIKAFGPTQGGGAARRLQGLHQGSLRARTTSRPRAYAALQRRRGSQGLSSRKHGAPIVVKADGLAAGKGVVVAETHRARREAAIDMMFGGGLGAAGAGSRDRGISRRRGSVLLRAVRRRDTRSPLASRAGPQARLRRRQGPEHRRHGRLFAGAGDDAGDAKRRTMDEIMLPTVRAMAGAGTPYQGRALRRADDHQRWARS